MIGCRMAALPSSPRTLRIRDCPPSSPSPFANSRRLAALPSSAPSETLRSRCLPPLKHRSGTRL
eukprot:1754350-Rhodomonas_salina.4